MTGINIPDMIKIVEEHGLIAVPVDFNIDTMQPNNFDDIKRLTNEKVRELNSNMNFRPSAYFSPTSLVCHMTSLQSSPF